MEDALGIYHRRENTTNPVVCVDETSKQHIKETWQPLPIAEGTPSGYNYQYQRDGVSNLFMIFAPLQGFRHVQVTDRRTNIDFATSVGIWLMFIFLTLKNYSGLRQSQYA